MCVSVFQLVPLVSENLTFFSMISFRTSLFRLSKSKFLRLSYTCQTNMGVCVFPNMYNMLLLRHQAISGSLLLFTWHKVCYCVWCRSYLFPPFLCILAERSLQSLLPCCLASVPLHRNIRIVVIVCSLQQKKVLSQTAFKLNTKDIERWCMGNNITPTLQKSAFLLHPTWVPLDMGHKNFLLSHSPQFFLPFRKNTMWQEVEKVCETHKMLKPSVLWQAISQHFQLRSYHSINIQHQQHKIIPFTIITLCDQLLATHFMQAYDRKLADIIGSRPQYGG